MAKKICKNLWYMVVKKSYIMLGLKIKTWWIFWLLGGLLLATPIKAPVLEPPARGLADFRPQKPAKSPINHVYRYKMQPINEYKNAIISTKLYTICYNLNTILQKFCFSHIKFIIKKQNNTLKIKNQQKMQLCFKILTLYYKFLALTL